MGLLPPSMQDKIEFMPLGKAIKMDETRAIQEKISARHEAMKNGDHAVARRIKDELRSAGVELTDHEAGTMWSKADPVREFEKHNHDIPCAPKLPRVTPEMASRALRSLCVDGLYEPSLNREYTEPWGGVFQKTALKQMERLDKLSELSKPPALTWPTLPDLPEPTFLPEVVNQAKKVRRA